MAALTQERDTPKRHEDFPIGYQQKGNTKVFSGSIVCADANGFAVAGADTANFKVLGRANQTGDTTAAGPAGLLADGIGIIEVDHGVFEWKTSGANKLTVADIGKTCFVLDDQTVVRTAGVANNIVAGVVLSVDANDNVLVDTRRRTV